MAGSKQVRLVVVLLVLVGGVVAVAVAMVVVVVGCCGGGAVFVAVALARHRKKEKPPSVASCALNQGQTLLVAPAATHPKRTLEHAQSCVENDAVGTRKVRHTVENIGAYIACGLLLQKYIDKTVAFGLEMFKSIGIYTVWGNQEMLNTVCVGLAMFKNVRI